jgi:D-glycero-D-manno-heptose 1,7-bisphosphate phosphatase
MNSANTANAAARRPAARWCVFFDRDGTLNAHVPRAGRRSSPRNPREWRALPGVQECFARLRAAGAMIAVVTNQPDLGRALVDRAALDDLHRRLGDLDGVYVCPHPSEHRCRCRKPSSLLLHRAARDLGVSLADSFLVGDRPTDAQAALNAGLAAVLLAPGPAPSRIPGLHYAPNLPAASAAVLRHRRHAGRPESSRKEATS